jgi:beta-glucuronidase
MKETSGKAILLTVTMLVFLVSCGPTQAVEPTTSQEPTMTALPLAVIPSVSIPLSGDWRFSIDRGQVGEKQGWFEPDYDDSSWITVTVPHTWNVMPEYLDYEGLGWYRRTFTVPVGSETAHLRLHFEAVFYLAKVWLNGQYLGQHEGGYTPFEFDVSRMVKPGGTNVLAVQVDNLRSTNRIPAELNPTWSFDWYNYGGITRDVSLEITSQAYISKQQIVSTPHLIGLDEADSATVTATITINNSSAETLIGSITANLLDNTSGNTVLDSPVSASVSIPADTSIDVKLTATLASPKLWHFDHPNLYRWSVSLVDADGQLLHRDEVTIGIRLVEMKNGNLYLNGEQVRLVGISRHEDYPGQGSAETVTAMAADYNDLKLLNEVLSRPVHYPQNQFILDYADRHGILLIPEIPAWQLTQQQMNSEHIQDLEKQQLSEMVSADVNHPSVFAWSVANEIESDTYAGKEFVKQMIAYVKSLDPTRPVGFASNRLYSNPQMDATSQSNFVMMNQYFGTWGGSKQGLGPELDMIHRTWPDKTIIISEFGFEPHWNELWGPSTSTLDANQYYFIPEGTPSDSEAADVVRQQLITEQMEIYRSKPFVAGAIFWTYQDYRTRSNFIMGLVDSQRNRRGSWEVLRDEYSPALIDSLTLSPATDGQRTATISLHTRGPIDGDMPVYTLRGYTLHWEVTSLDSKTLFSQGDVSLPTLAPTTPWTGEFKFSVPSQAYSIAVSIFRPTGFSITNRSFDAQGGQLP